MTAAPVESRWTEAAGETIHARVATRAAPAGAPEVILVHGLCVSSRYMVPLLGALAPSARAHAPDLPGFGLSSKPREALDIAGLARSLSAWMEAAGPVRGVLVGNSVGCQVAVALAVAEPARVERLVLLGPTFEPSARSAAVQTYRWLRDVPREPRSLFPVVLRDYLDCGTRRLVATFSHALADRIEEKLPDVTAPTLVLRGTRDPIVPDRWAADAVRRLPHGRLAAIPNAAHDAHYSHSREVARLVLDFATGDDER